MFTKSAIDMSRPRLIYGAGLGILMLASLAVSNVPDLAFSTYFDIPHRKEICAGLFASGSLMGCWALLRHMARSAKPWRVPQSQVAIPYVLFFLSTLGAIAIAH